MKKLSKLNRWLRFTLPINVALLSAFNTSHVVADPAIQPGLTGLPKHELVDLIWKVSSTGSSAAAEQVLPLLGINDAPPPLPKKPGYSYTSISSAQAEVSPKTRLRMISLGVGGVSYATHDLNEERRVGKYLHVELDRRTTCITPENVISSFGTAYRKAPARIINPIPASPEFPAAKLRPPDNEITSLNYTTLFLGNGSVQFTFEFHRCAESITLNSQESS